jgi:hypothetical protein
MITWANQNSPLPVMALWGFSVGHGKAVGGLVIDGEAQGIRAAEIALAYFPERNQDELRIVIGEEGRHLFRSGLITYSA